MTPIVPPSNFQEQYPQLEKSAATFSQAERDAVYKVIGERRDIRHFRADPIPDEVLSRILWAGHHAGSVGFMQPWSFIRVRDHDLRVRLRDSAERQRQAAAAAMAEDPGRSTDFMRLKVEGILDCPEVVVVTVDPTRGGNHVLGRYSDLDNDLFSACCAIQNLWLAARAEGVGMGWVSFFHPGEVQQALGIPPHIRPLAILCLGWPQAIPAAPLLELVGWEKRLPIADVIFLDRWGERPSLQEDPFSYAGPPVNLRLDAHAMELATQRQNQLTKPTGSLGRLEGLSVRLAGMAGKLDVPLADRVVFTLAADHGVALEGVSAYPREVTAQMVQNFLRGGAAINVLARQMNVRVVVADLGVAAEMDPHPDLKALKVRRGTASISSGPAMTADEVTLAIEHGRSLVRDEIQHGLDIVLTGDMGIGNTTPSAALVCAFTGLHPVEIVGRGTGVDDQGLDRKREAVAKALEINRAALGDPLHTLAALGGLEIAGLVGVMVEAASRRKPVLIDGFVSGAAALAAVRIDPSVSEFLIASHCSAELGHRATLAALGLEPLLDLGLRLGEGTGAVLALPLVEASVRLLNEMATFESAAVTNRS
ncbi:MAG TPA: nicotinate-nucleotide--dimethylbenzimidazole phosphoribosyltransferase [Candidatus Dormibacteraeota bacterium]|jgi:nicotinate-nucleotide--dimethylbenzimidazole phosphoribosyltransferase|nr:nicotinate-nucleotide--dimethylbenzimidazole phosphoribosyltransferase [Candidatus Dormibacteraeota bacterium]